MMFVSRKGSQITGLSAAVVERSLIVSRLKPIVSLGRPVRPSPRALRGLLIAFFFPAIYVTAFTGVDQQQSRISITTQQEAKELESTLLHKPDDLKVHSALIIFYANERNEASFLPHLLWAIHHHPENPIATMRIYRPLAKGTADQLTAAWDDALIRYPDSPEVLFHAALFLESKDPERALNLLDRATTLPQTDSSAKAAYLKAVSVIYAVAVMSEHRPTALINDIKMDQNLARALRLHIENSGDPAMLCEVGTDLVQLREDEAGFSFIQRAIDLDPSNAKWREALDSAKAEPIRRQNIRMLAGAQR